MVTKNKKKVTLTSIDKNVLYKVSEAAKLLGASKTTLDKWRASGYRGPLFIQDCGYIRYLGADLLNYLEQKKSDFFKG